MHNPKRHIPHLSLPLAVALVVALGLAAAPAADAVTVEHLTLDQMVSRAGSGFLVTVVGARQDTVRAGGGELPVRVYRLRVDDPIKGSFSGGDDGRHVEIRFLAAGGAEQRRHLLRYTPLPELPTLRVGGRYFLLLTPESSIGLTAPVGLAQGTFRVTGKPGSEQVVNGLDNAGLFRDVESLAPAGWERGPIDWTDFAATVRDLATR